MNSSNIDRLLLDALENNSSILGNNTDTSESSAGNFTFYQIIASLFLFLLSTVTVVANSLVLYLFYKSKKTLRSPSHILLANLAFADLLVGLLVMPLLGSVTVSHKYHWYWGTWMCFLSDYVHFTLCAASMLSMIGVAVERFIGIRFPLKHKYIMSTSLVKKIIVAIWTFAITMISVPLTVWPYVQDGPSVCMTNLNKPFVIFISIAVYFVPISLTALLYIMIFIFAFRPLPLALTRQVTKRPSSSSKSTAANQKENRFMTARQRQITLTKSLAVILLTMIAMFGPVFTMFILKGFESPIFTFELLLAAGWLRYCNSCVNPFLFALAVPGYRREFYKVFLNERRGSTDHDESSCTSISESNDGENKKASDDKTGNEQSAMIMNRPNDFEVRQTAAASAASVASVASAASAASVASAASAASVSFADESKGGLKEPPCLIPIKVVAYRFCTYCGVQMTRDEIDKPGKLQSCYCNVCFQKFASGEVTFTDSVINHSKLSCSKASEANKDKLETTSVSESTGESALRNEIDEKLLVEIRRYFKLSETIPTFNELDDREYSKGKSETQLQSNLMKILKDSGEYKIHEGGTNLKKYDEKNFRTSIMSPIMKRRTRMVQNKKPTEIDWNSIRELDEIIVKLNSTVFGSTVTNHTNQ